jgi:hypothetical protein
MLSRLLNRREAAPRLTLLLLAAGAAAACTDVPYRGPLLGTWTVSMTLEAGLPGHRVPPGTTVTGLVIVPDSAPITPRSFPDDAAPADVRVDLRPFGLRIEPRKQPLVRDQGGGGVRLQLGSAPDELVLVGRLEGDSVAGMWYDEFRSGGAAGRFVMHRSRLGGRD